MNETDVRKVAYEARDSAREAHGKIEAHEELCAERYLNINTSVSEIKSILKWAGSTLFGLIALVLGWSVVQQISAEKAATTAQIEMLRQQMADDVRDR